jgi:hypothetical protein
VTTHLSEYVNELITRAGVPDYKLAGASVKGTEWPALTVHLSQYHM